MLQAALGPKNVVLAARVPSVPPQKTKLEYQVYDLQGELVRTLPAPTQILTTPRCRFPIGASPAACLSSAGRLRFQDADATRLVYVLDSTVHLMQLANGKEKTYAGTARAPVYAQLEAAGLVYASGTSGRTQGRVQFVPAAKLR